jgi:uncharacterized membrane protein YqjE
MADDAPPPPEKPTENEPPTLLQAVGALLRDLPGLLTDRVRLLSLELRRASAALGQMVVLALIAAILCATAWLALWIGIVTVLVKLGLGLAWACVVVIVINLAGAAWAGMRLKALAPLLALPATLRRMGGEEREPEKEPPPPDPPRQSGDPHVAREREPTPAP